MSAPALVTSLAPAAQAAEEHGTLLGVNPYVVGGTVLVILVLAIAALMAFGAGRDHT